MDDVVDLNRMFLAELHDAASAGDEVRLQALGASSVLVNRIGMLSIEDRESLASMPTSLISFQHYQPGREMPLPPAVRELRLCLAFAQRAAAQSFDPVQRIRHGLTLEHCLVLCRLSVVEIRAIADGMSPRLEVRQTRALEVLLDSSIGGETTVSSVRANRLFHVVRSMSAAVNDRRG